MLAIIHLVTLGWITASILGSLYLVAPIALRSWLPAGRLDYMAFALIAIGIIGMVSHFWIQTYGGMGWSGITAALGMAVVAVRLTGPLGAAPIPLALRVHIALAFINILLAATMGVLLGFNKVHPFLPGYVLTNVYAHAHLAAIGWASLMVVGVAYRWLPMVLPAEMPHGPRLSITAVLLESGVVGLFVTLVTRSRLIWLFALLVVAGFGVPRSGRMDGPASSPAAAGAR